MYWVQKYSMFYRYRRPVPASDFINQAVYQFVHFGPFIYSLGSLTWSNFMPNGIPENALIPNLITLGFSVLIFVVPIKVILITCFFDEETKKPSAYEEERITFSTEYDRLNPTTQEEATQEYHKYCQNYAENFKKFSAEKQAEIARKKKRNNEIGQLNNHHGGNQPAGSLRNIGGHNAANFLSGFVQQPQQQAPNPMMAAFAGGMPKQQPMPGPGLGALVPGPQVNPMPQPNMMNQGRAPAYSALFAAPANPMMGMMGMGGMGMGAPQGGYLNPMAQMYGGGGGYRMW